jgi:hypothetical protein
MAGSSKNTLPWPLTKNGLLMTRHCRRHEDTMEKNWRDFFCTVRKLAGIFGFALLAIVSVVTGFLVNAVFTFMPLWMLLRGFGIQAHQYPVLVALYNFLKIFRF